MPAFSEIVNLLQKGSELARLRVKSCDCTKTRMPTPRLSCFSRLAGRPNVLVAGQLQIDEALALDVNEALAKCHALVIPLIAVLLLQKTLTLADM